MEYLVRPARITDIDRLVALSDAELREFLIESYRHYATRRAIARLEAQSS